MAEKILDNFYIIKIPLPNNPLKNINIYFIKGTDRNLMIDTGFNMPICYEAMQQGLKDINADMANTDIFLTHLHSDHTGLSSSIASADSLIYMSKTDGDYMKQFFQPEYWDWVDERYLSFGFSKPELEENRTKNPATLYLPSKQMEITPISDGAIIDLGNYKFKCLLTPGHTPGHTCLFEADKGILFSGDHIIFDITPNITSWRNVDNSLKLYLESLEMIKHFDVKSTYSAHRNPIGNCRKRIDEIVEHHGKRLDEAYNIVKSGEAAAPYQVASKMTWSIRSKNWNTFPVSQKWFAVGEAYAHLEYLRLEGMLSKDLSQGMHCYYAI